MSNHRAEKRAVSRRRSVDVRGTSDSSAQQPVEQPVVERSGSTAGKRRAVKPGRSEQRATAGASPVKVAEYPRRSAQNAHSGHSFRPDPGRRRGPRAGRRRRGHRQRPRHRLPARLRPRPAALRPGQRAQRGQQHQLHQLPERPGPRGQPRLPARGPPGRRRRGPAGRRREAGQGAQRRPGRPRRERREAGVADRQERLAAAGPRRRLPPDLALRRLLEPLVALPHRPRLRGPQRHPDPRGHRRHREPDRLRRRLRQPDDRHARGRHRDVVLPPDHDRRQPRPADPGRRASSAPSARPATRPARTCTSRSVPAPATRSTRSRPWSRTASSRRSRPTSLRRRAGVAEGWAGAVRASRRGRSAAAAA